MGELNMSKKRSFLIKFSQVKFSKVITSQILESKTVKSGGFEVIDEVSKLKPSKSIEYSRGVTTSKTPGFKSYVKTRTI